MNKVAHGGVTLRIDNKSAISLSKTLFFHDRSKHIETRYHYIRECVENGHAEVEYVRTEDQLADTWPDQVREAAFQDWHDQGSRKCMSLGSEC
jgi:O-succinylbenzoate synthase